MSLKAGRIIKRMRESKSPTCWDGCVAWRRDKLRDTFSEIVYKIDYDKGGGWEVVGIGDSPKGTFTWCAFCGCRIKHCILVRRLIDDACFKVGRDCVGRVGLEVPKDVRRLRFRRDPVPLYRKVEKPKEREETHPGMKKFLEEQKKKEDEEFVREINESVKVEEKPKKPEKKESIEEDEDGYNLDDIFED